MSSGLSRIALLLALTLATTPLYAQGRGKGQAKKPSAAAARPADKAGHAKPETGKKPTPTTTADGGTKTKGNPHKTPRTDGTAPVASVTPTTTVTSTTPTTRAVKNPKLESRLLVLLPAGSNIQDASQGFKNWGQFVAAVHVSNNLNIPFADLKTQMTGTNPVSLGQAIQSLKGGTTTSETETFTRTKIKKEVKKAEDAANEDLSRTRDRT